MKQNILLFCLATQRTYTHALWKQLKTITSNYAEFRIQNLRDGTLQSVITSNEAFRYLKAKDMATVGKYALVDREASSFFLIPSWLDPNVAGILGKC